MKKTIALLLAAILLLSLAACGQTAQPAEPAATEVPAEAPAEVESSAEPDNSNVNYSLRVAQMGTSIKAAMVVLANEMGYYAEEGLDVTFEPINNLNDGITAILGGSLDILPFGVIPTCTFVAQGADLTVIGGTIAEGSECVMTPENAATYTDGDLTWFAGKRVACVRPETGHMIMMQKIAQAGVDMTTVKFVELDGFQSVVEAVLKGEADVGFVNSGFGQNAKTQGLEVPFLVGDLVIVFGQSYQTAMCLPVQLSGLEKRRHRMILIRSSRHCLPVLPTMMYRFFLKRNVLNLILVSIVEQML